MKIYIHKFFRFCRGVLLPVGLQAPNDVLWVHQHLSCDKLFQERDGFLQLAEPVAAEQ